MFNPQMLLELMPTTGEAILGFLVAAAVLFVTAIVERALRPGGLATRLMPEQAQQRLHTWVPRAGVLLALLAGIDAAGSLPVREAIALVHTGLTFPLLELAAGKVTVLNMLLVVAVLLVASRISQLVQDAIARTLRGRDDADEGMIASLQRLGHYVVLLLGLAIGLQSVGFDLSALLAASAVLGVGIAFGLQTISENFVAGLILLFERSIRPKDLLTVGDRVVRVESMGIRSTVCTSLEDETIIVPNADLVKSTVINHSNPIPEVRARAIVGVAYESDVDQVLEVLDAAARTLEARDPLKDPIVFLKDFGDSSIVFEISIWARSAWSRPRLLSGLRVAIWRALAEHDITIAFPQLDVHLDTSVTDRLGSHPRDQRAGSSPDAGTSADASPSPEVPT